jgi:hypothetical protein
MIVVELVVKANEKAPATTMDLERGTTSNGALPENDWLGVFDGA